MAHSKQAKKRILLAEKANTARRAVRTRLRTHIKNVRKAISEGNQDSANQLFKAAMSYTQRCVNKNILHKNTCARLSKRLNAQIVAIGKS